jgi:hypothetical protein
MRGCTDPQIQLSLVTPEQLLPADHPIRHIKPIVGAALRELMRQTATAVMPAASIRRATSRTVSRSNLLRISPVAAIRSATSKWWRRDTSGGGFSQVRS